MYRTDYNAEMVANYRQQVLDYIVPVTTELRKRQQARIGVEKLAYYDENFEFATGNPTPKGDADWIVDHGKTMYKELSIETDEFFNFMLDNDLLDLVAKKEKLVADIVHILRIIKRHLFSQTSMEHLVTLMY